MLEGQVRMIAMGMHLRVANLKRLNGNSLQFVLWPENGSDRFRRKNAALNRRLNATCWHGYEEFMAECYRLNPNAKFRTALASYSDVVDFHRQVRDAEPISIGGGVSYQEACMC